MSDKNKGGHNETFQITERPPPPQPTRKASIVEPVITKEDVIESLRKRVQMFPTAAAYAAYIGTSPSVLSQVVNGSKLPTRAILDDLGYVKKKVTLVSFERRYPDG